MAFINICNVMWNIVHIYAPKRYNYLIGKMFTKYKIIKKKTDMLREAIILS